ncbi:hypothetical protein DGG96_02090 [Legionella qingyii]|uniref:Uncharacterized protein n=1 Tax=Legionella qingyii TaxID=2184757 RepID=A0A317U691_9GAMM|nr:hypothetical protein [Legionella qingyii]PWY56522.1 hypothetical protein DGG96_07100 [Legionella qingyii]PWY57121.1 hypothetical protein DGG96_02090 [Legionella qingyii]RUR25039.1 hypothetical protein ELY20_04585 [Legionella qingyii]RUR28689.1 hypothetical protein ELY16_01395 [Legionella qingyii]
MAIMKHESIKPSPTVEGMSSAWLTIRVVNNDVYQFNMGLNEISAVVDTYVSIEEFSKNPFQAIEQAINQQSKISPVLFTKKMERTSACGQEQTSVSMDIYLATYIVEVQFPSSTVNSAKKKERTVYENAFELPKGIQIQSNQIKRMVLDVLGLERHLIVALNKTSKNLERHEICLFKENDTWFYRLSGEEQAYILPNIFEESYQRSIYDSLDVYARKLPVRTPQWIDLCNGKYGELAMALTLEVFKVMASAGHIPKDFGLDYHFPLVLDRTDPTNLAMMLIQGSMQQESNLSKLPADLINRIFADSVDKKPEEVSAYINKVNESVKNIYTASIAPQLICKGSWNNTPSISISCPNDPTLIDKFYQSSLQSFHHMVNLDPKNHQIIMKCSKGLGDQGVYLANEGHELAIAFASQEERDSWAELMGFQHDYYNQGIGIWADHPQCIYFTSRFFLIQELKQYIQEKYQKTEAIVQALDTLSAEPSSILTRFSLFVQQFYSNEQEEMKSNLKCCNQQILAAKLLIDVLNNKSDVDGLREKYPAYVSIMEHDEVLHGILAQIEENSSAPQPM